MPHDFTADELQFQNSNNQTKLNYSKTFVPKTLSLLGRYRSVP